MKLAQNLTVELLLKNVIFFTKHCSMLMRFHIYLFIWQSNSKVHIHWKGAAEIVLSSCTGYLDSNGCLQSIDENKVIIMFLLGKFS